jgi:hypothetical protein
MAQDDAKARGNFDVRKDDGNVAGNLVGEGVGSVSGVATGAALGSLGGPVGTVIGALAGAVGGWWAGRGISESAASYSDHDDTHYQDHHIRLTPRTTAADATATAARASMGEGMGAASSATGYDAVRPAYQLGHLAGRNPDYANRSFDEVEADLQRGWTGDVAARHGDWTSVRPYARTAFDRSRAGGSHSGVSHSGGGLADRAPNALHDLKDRFDGNPASRPGPDATDSPRR